MSTLTETLRARRNRPAEPITEETATPEPAALVRHGVRATGKRSDPDYTRFAAFVPKDVLRKAKRKAEDEQEPDLSVVITRLLRQYVA